MSDIALDTNVLADVIAVFYEERVNSNGFFKARYNLTESVIEILNSIVRDVRLYESPFSGLVVSSAFAYIELARKFDQISAGRFTLDQFKAFVDSPPAWIVIESVDEHLFEHLRSLPASVEVGGNLEQVEWADALHIATALARQEMCYIATTDVRIRNITLIEERLLT